MSGTDGTDFVGEGGSVQWSGVFRRVLGAIALMWASLIATFWSGLFSGVGWVLDSWAASVVMVPVTALQRGRMLVATALATGGQLAADQFGILAWPAGILLLIAFFTILEIAVSFIRRNVI